MNEAAGREAAKLAKIRAADGRLGPDQVEAIARGTCILMPYADPAPIRSAESYGFVEQA